MAKAIQKILRKDKYWQKLLKNRLRKGKHWQSQLRKAFMIDPLTTNNAIYRDSLTLNCTM